jgi:two-component system cell cycle response regulator
MQMIKLSTVLIVDDDPSIRKVLKGTLVGRYITLEADGGETAIKMATESPPDLIILDVEMPGLSGIDVCKKLKEMARTKRIPVMLISSSRNKEEVIVGLQAGADDYLTKPIYPPEILARVDAHLRYKSYYDDLERDDLQMLLELADSVSVLRNPMKILRVIVEKFADLIAVERCSIVGLDTSGEFIVKASNDLDENVEIKLDMARYPEILKALETRSAVVVNDIKNDPLMESARPYVSGLNLNSIIVVPIIKKESVIGTLFLGTATSLKDGISDRIYKLCHLVANISANALENASLFESINSAKDFFEEMSIRDGLTRLYSHRHFYDRLEVEFSRALRHNEPLSLVFFDIDDFKKVNDKYGHLRGDEVLRQIGNTMKDIVRESDVAARYGGEEFVLLLPNTCTDGASKLANRLSASIRGFRYKGLESEKITVSIGIATFDRNNLLTFDQLVDLANQAMHKAKREGKNRVVLVTELESTDSFAQ